jgi:hypothetical protein
MSTPTLREPYGALRNFGPACPGQAITLPFVYKLQSCRDGYDHACCRTDIGIPHLRLEFRTGIKQDQKHTMSMIFEIG